MWITYRGIYKELFTRQQMTQKELSHQKATNSSLGDALHNLQAAQLVIIVTACIARSVCALVSLVNFRILQDLFTFYGLRSLPWLPRSECFSWEGIAS